MSLFRRNKSNDKPLIKQILELIPSHLLRRVVKTHKSDKGCSKYKTYDQLVALLFGQLGKLNTLEDISVGIGVSKTFIKDLGLLQSPAKSTMSDGNKKRSYKVFEDLYYKLLTHYGNTLTRYSNRKVVEEVRDKTIKIRDSTTISLCLSLFNWAKFRTAKGGIKIHTQFDEAMKLPDLVNIKEAKEHDVNGFEQMVFLKDTIIIEDMGYWDFDTILKRHKAGNIMVTRIKENTVYESVQELELPEHEDTHILKDELIRLTGKKAMEIGLDKINFRRVVVYNEEKNETIEVFTNQCEWKASTICDLYKRRWDVETFFKLIKQNLNIKTFIGTSPNALKSQIYVALIVYLLLELMRRTIANGKAAFSNFVEKIRICLFFYLPLQYVIKCVEAKARSIRVEQGQFNYELSDGLFG